MSLLRYLLLVLLLAGCARTRAVTPGEAELPAGFPYHTAAQIQSAVRLSADTLYAFRAKASFAVDTPEQKGSFSADIRDRRGDSLYMSISPGLGIEAARVLVTRDSLYLYDRLKNRVTYGSLAAAGNLLAVPVTADDLFMNLLGLIAPEPGVAWQVEAVDAHYHLTAPDGTRRYVVDPARWRVVRFEARTPEGELLEERAFSDFDRFDGLYLPRRVVFRRPPERSTASLFYRSLELNPDALSFDLRISSSADRVPVGGAR